MKVNEGTTQMRTLLKLFALPLLFLLTLSSALAATAYVHDLKGSLTATVGNNPARSIKMGDTLDAGVTLATSKDSVAVIKFEDGQLVTMSADTQFAVRQYNYNKASVKDSNIAFDLLRGGLRFVTGVIGATDNNKFKLTVGTATIGVRGTDGWASYVEGVILAAVNQGALSFTTPQGTQTIPVLSTAVAGTGVQQTLVAPSNQLAQVMAAGGVAPSVAANVQSARAVQTQINNVQVPINTPVVVAAAAQAAQVVATARVAQGLAAAAANSLAAATTDAQRAAALQAKASADAAAAKATALATAAIATAQAAAVQALNAVVSAGAVLPTAPPPAPTAAPLTAVVPTLTPTQIQTQAATVETAVVTQTTSLQTTQTTLGLPVTNTTTIQNAPPAPPPPGTTPLAPPPPGSEPPPPLLIDVIIPPPTVVVQPVSPS